MSQTEYITDILFNFIFFSLKNGEIINFKKEEENPRKSC